MSQLIECFYGSTSLELISINELKTSLKSNVIISLGEMIKSLGKQTKKDKKGSTLEENWKTST